MPGKEHSLITKQALSLLPDWQLDMIGNEADNLAEKYCTYPDGYFDVNNGGHERTAPYFFETDDIQFHYIPDTPIVKKYRYWKVKNGRLELPEQPENANWKHAKNGFTYYLTKAVECLKKSKIKDALSFTGCLIHMLQDSCFGLHSFEGPYGTDVFVLDRIFDSDDNPDMLPSNIMAEYKPPSLVTCPEHNPVNLGNSIEEVVFVLYSRYVHTCLRARKLTFKIVIDLREERDCTAYYVEMFQNSVKLITDVLNTIFCLATDTKASDRDIILSDIEPIERPWGSPGPYRFLTMLRDKALNNNKEIVPLKLVVDGVEKEYEKGMSFGSHAELKYLYDIPRGIYKSFTCIIGLQSEFVDTGEARIRFSNDEHHFLDATFNRNNPSSRISFQNPGGTFEIVCSSPESVRSKTVITWADPLLKK